MKRSARAWLEEHLGNTPGDNRCLPFQPWSFPRVSPARVEIHNPQTCLALIFGLNQRGPCGWRDDVVSLGLGSRFVSSCRGVDLLRVTAVWLLQQQQSGFAV